MKADAAVLPVDHQAVLTNLVQDFAPEHFKNNVLALADCAEHLICLAAGREAMNDRPDIVTAVDLKSPVARRNGTAVVVDVRAEADFKRCHLRGAVNNCVYEVGFVERMASIAPDKKVAVCVYGEGPDTLEAHMAAEKLVRTGYAKVLESRDGPAGFIEGGLPVKERAGEPEPAVPGPDGRKEVDLAESRIEWTGRNLLSRHRGTLAIKSGYLDSQEGALTGGEVVFDMNAIACEDLHDVLVDHLRRGGFSITSACTL